MGGTVKLNVIPTVQDASAKLLTFTVNGKEYVSAYENGAITIENSCSNKLVIVAKYTKPKFAATVEAGMWNLSDLDKRRRKLYRLGRARLGHKNRLYCVGGLQVQYGRV